MFNRNTSSKLQKNTITILVKFLFLAILSIIAKPTFSFNASSGADFLILEPSSRMLGQGGAYIANLTDLSGIIVNPSSIAFMKEPQIYFMHQSTLVEFQTDYLAFGAPLSTFIAAGSSLPKSLSWLRELRLGLSFLFFHTKDEEIIGNDSNTPEKIVSIYDLYGSLGLGYNLFGYRLGLSTKIISRTLADYSSSSVALDFGATKGFEVNALRFLPYPVRYNLKVALAITNIGPGIEFAGLSEPLPLNVKTGITYGIFGNKNHLIDFSLGTSTLMNESTYINLGIEYRVLKYFYFRSGVEIGPGQFEESSFTIGTGISYEFRKVNYRLDYAFLPRKDDVYDNHNFSLHVALLFWGPKTKKRVSSMGILMGDGEGEAEDGSKDSDLSDGDQEGKDKSKKDSLKKEKKK